MTAEFAKSEQQRLYAEMDTLCRARAAITNSESQIENSEEIIGRLSIDISEKAKDIASYQELWFQPGGINFTPIIKEEDMGIQSTPPLTATEAQKLTMRHEQTIHETQFSEILGIIQEACLRGQYSITDDRVCNPRVREMLTQYGYKVGQNDSDPESQLITVSWDAGCVRRDGDYM